MAEPPPKPKVGGSLRDRIAMFEQKPAEPAAAPPPGGPRGKVGTWKPKPLEREHAPVAEAPHKLDLSARSAVRPDPPSPERKPKATGGMSAADAQASITTGGAMSMKERMAALAGKGGFGGPAPALALPVHATTKPGVPKTSITPTAASPSDEKSLDLDSASAEVGSGADTVTAPATHSGAAGDADADATATGTAATSDEHIEPQSEATGEDKTEEELERERRAAIAARLARLGGTRLGMVPQYGRPPVPTGTKPARKESQDAEDSHTAPAALVATPFAMASKPDAPTHIDLPERKISATEVPLPPSVAATSPPVLEPAAPPPASMPMPAVPKRALPPRKKASKTPAAQTKVEDEPPATAATVTVDESDVPTDGDDKKTEQVVDEAAPEPRPLLRPDAPAASDLSKTTLAHVPLPESVMEAREATSEPESTPSPAKHDKDAEDASEVEPTPAERIVKAATEPEQESDKPIHDDGPYVHRSLEKALDSTDDTPTAAPKDTNSRPSQDDILDDIPSSDKDGHCNTSYESQAAANLVDVRPEQSRLDSDDKREDVAGAPTHAASAAANLVDVQAEQQAEDELEERKAYQELVSADKVPAIPEEKEYVMDIVEPAALDAGKDDGPARAGSPDNAQSIASATSAHPKASEDDEDRDRYAKSAGTAVEVEVVVPTTVRADVVVDTRRAKGKDDDEDDA